MGHGSLTKPRGARLIHPPAAQLPAAAQPYTAAHLHAAVHIRTNARAPLTSK